MGRFGKKDPKLSEVKAVLERLQGLPAESKPAGPRPDGGDSRSAVRKAGIFAAAVILGSVATAVGSAYLIVGVKRPPPPPDRPPITASVPSPQIDPAKVPVVKAVIESARTLMSNGRVRAAREQLRTFATQGSPDAAWDLARSYDPNFIASLPVADETPDFKEAERWYRAWYAAAVQEGLIADSVSLERIIRSMKQ